MELHIVLDHEVQNVTHVPYARFAHRQLLQVGQGSAIWEEQDTLH